MMKSREINVSKVKFCAPFSCIFCNVLKIQNYFICQQIKFSMQMTCRINILFMFVAAITFFMVGLCLEASHKIVGIVIFTVKIVQMISLLNSALTLVCNPPPPPPEWCLYGFQHRSCPQHQYKSTP